jgi:hypothetical protein
MIRNRNTKINTCLIKTLALACLVLVFLLSACDKPKKITDLPKNVTVLVDYSASTKQARMDYTATWEAVMKKVNMDDHIFVWKISDKSAMEPRALLDESFIPDSPPKNDFQKRQARSGMRKNIDEAKMKFLMIYNRETKLSGRTAIFDSLQVVERSFKNNKRDRSILVIMSDMVEDSRYNFEKENLTDNRIDAIISELKKKQLICDLAGVQVYVVGACATGTVANDRFNRIKKLWLRYFKETGANLREENYGSALIGFNE